MHFLKRRVTYLGHEVSRSVITPEPQNMVVVQEWTVPHIAKKLKIFLGFASYNSRFTESFARIAGPLHQLVNDSLYELKINKKPSRPPMAKWNCECQEAFDTLCKTLTTAPVLGYADNTKPFTVKTDASHDGLGVVLSQEQDGKRRVIANASHRLRPPEKNTQNHSSWKLELLAPKWAVTETFKSYLLETEFTYYTDNNPLSRLQWAKFEAVEQKWAAELAFFDFKMKHRLGRANGNADALWRIERGNFEKEITYPDELVQKENIGVTLSIPVPVELRELVTNCTTQVQPNRGIPETLTSLPPTVQLS